MMTESAVSGSSFSWPSLQYLNGRFERSILLTVSVKILVPKRMDWFLFGFEGGGGMDDRREEGREKHLGVNAVIL